MRYIKTIVLGMILVLTAIIFWLNLTFYSENFTVEEKREDILLQLNFIGKELKSNQLGSRMQEIFPEGFVFVNTLYGLAWCEVAYSIPEVDSDIKKKAISEALFAYDEIDSDRAKMRFDKELMPVNGIYYAGWKNYLLSKLLKIDTTFSRYSSLKTVFVNECEAISAAVEASDTPYLQSYANQVWPADMFPAVVSMKSYNDLYEPKYGQVIDRWVKNVKGRLDLQTKMIPHKVNLDGTAVDGPRGSSISLIIRLLAEIEPDFAREQYGLYKEKFVTTTFGLPSVREYPKGQSGMGDIDSGPVIFGVGFAGTIVAIGLFSKLGDVALAQQQYKTIHAFGFAVKSAEKKKYVLGLLPIADAFIAWGRATDLNSKNSAELTKSTWRIEFHVISVFVIVMLWSIFYAKSILTKLVTWNHVK